MTASLNRGAGSVARNNVLPAVALRDRECDGDSGRRLLMIAHDFPPAGTSAALRALKFARHLSAYGWYASVVTVGGRCGSTDPTLLHDVPSYCRVSRAFGFDTKAVLSIRTRYPRLLATPDRAASWFPHGVVSCMRVVRAEQPDALLSTSPPVTAHCIGLAVKRMTRLPWIVELRDPWNLDAPFGPLSRRFDRRLERRILLAADRVVVTTDGLAADLEDRLGTEVGRKIAVVPNGYDEETFARLPPLLPASRAPFRIIHTGRCTPPERDPVPFLRAVRRCLDRDELPSDTEVHFIGSGEQFDGALAEELNRLRLESTVYSTPWRSHAQALQAMLEASLLLVLQTREEHRYCIPAKAYEYLRSRAQILVVARPESATGAFLSGFPGVLQAAPADPTQIAERLAEAYRDWQAVDREPRVARRIERYSSRQLAGNLARLLDALADPRAAQRRRAS